MLPDPTIAETIVITGCNRGIGYELVKLIASKNPGTCVIATARSDQQALKKKIDLQFPGNNINIYKLDISNEGSIINFGNQLKDLGVKIDIIVNNAAIMVDKLSNSDACLSAQLAKQTFNTNVYGCISLTNQLLPLLKDHGRVINISSALGALKYHGSNVQQIFQNPQITMNEIDIQIQKYIIGCSEGNLGQFFNHGYGTSKMILNAWSRFILSKMLKQTQVAIAMSPGHCRTDMGGQKGDRSPEQGALSVYILLWGQYTSDKFYHARGIADYQNCSV